VRTPFKDGGDVMDRLYREAPASANSNERGTQHGRPDERRIDVGAGEGRDEDRSFGPSVDGVSRRNELPQECQMNIPSATPNFQRGEISRPAYTFSKQARPIPRRQWWLVSARFLTPMFRSG
jgi:hypothetical protein